MSSRDCSVALCCTLWALSVPATAQPITAFWQRAAISSQAIASDPALADMQCWDLMATTSGNWAIAELRGQLLPGLHFYNPTRGGNTRPSSAIVQAFPHVEFDTYVTAPADVGLGNVPTILGGLPDGTLSFGGPDDRHPGIVSVVWGELVPDPPGTYAIARLTFPQGALPNVFNLNDTPPGRFSMTLQDGPEAAAEIPEIPEPAAGMAVGAVLMLILHSKRRVERR